LMSSIGDTVKAQHLPFQALQIFNESILYFVKF
jgi:hypothetical protein